MARSKLVKTNEKIAEKLTVGFKKLSDTIIQGYTRIEDGFVDRYLTKDGETIEAAKKRIKQEQKEIKNLHFQNKIVLI